MTTQTVIPQLFQACPELKSVSDKVLSDYGDETPGPYTVFSDVLLPATFSAMDAGDEAAARRYFNFYERVAGDPDEAVNALSHIELIEELANDRGRLAKAWPLMGPATREQARVYAREKKRQFGKEVWLPE